MCNKEKFWPALCKAIGREVWLDDPRFKDFPARLANRSDLQDLLDDALSERSTSAWLEVFAGTVPAAPIYDIQQALDNPFVANEGRVMSMALDGCDRPIRTLAPPIKTDVPPPARPQLGRRASLNPRLRRVGLLRSAAKQTSRDSLSVAKQSWMEPLATYSGCSPWAANP